MAAQYAEVESHKLAGPELECFRERACSCRRQRGHPDRRRPLRCIPTES
jgi:hypothetical protein